MSYTIPGRDPGPQGTEPPSTPCTGDFLDKLHCEKNGWFLWVGAFCVIVVICWLCSCFVVTPISRYLRDYLSGTDGSKRRVAVAPAGDYEEANAKNGVRRKSSLKPTHSKSLHAHKNHHWYLDDVLKITAEDEMELGRRPPAYTVPTAKTTAASSWTSPEMQGHHNHHHHHNNKSRDSSTKRSSMSSNRAASDRSVLYAPSRDNNFNTEERANAANYRRHSRRWTTELVVDDPGIGAEATLRGGGWMGADNGRL